MTIEEKAKAYDEVREKIAIRFGSNVADEIFSPFEMSDDERIRKELIKETKGSEVRLFETVTNDEFIDWLEKHGEQKPVGKIQLGKKYKCITSPRYSTFMKGKIYKPEDKFLCSLMNFCSDCFEPIEDGEQKSADKVEPKFKVGDWVVNTVGDTNQVVKVWDYGYTLDDNTFLSNSWATEHYHLWDITKDAKEGDVLYESSANTILIFRSQTCGWIKVYCDFWINKNKFTGTDPADYGRISEMDLKPATKEQRDLLFQKMKEAGYEWNVEKKELKKIEQEPYPETLDKAIELYYHTYGNGKGGFDNLSLEQFKDIVKTFVDDYGMQNHAWSEEDEFMATAVENSFYLHCGQMTDRLSEQYKKFFKKVKSFRPQSTWKPSELQIESLLSKLPVLKGGGDKVQDILESLYNDLKKLREVKL